MRSSPTPVAAVSFVGSTPVARAIYETGTRNGKRVQALGGAKNHMVVLPDADVGLAADAAVSAAYGSAGERCMAISVVVAVGGVADGLVAAIEERIPRIQVGPGDDPASEMGPLVTREHRDRVASYLDAAAADGATCGSTGGPRRCRPRGTTSAARWWMESVPECVATTTRSSAPCSPSSGSTATTRRCAW